MLAFILQIYHIVHLWLNVSAGTVAGLRAYSEGLAVEIEAVSQTTLGFSLDPLFVVFQSRAWFPAFTSPVKTFLVFIVDGGPSCVIIATLVGWDIFCSLPTFIIFS